MRLRIVTPLAVVIDEGSVLAVRAEDSTGGFGILPGHADFLTSLVISVVRWTGTDGVRRYCAVRRGLLSVTAGREIAVATREAIPGDDIANSRRGGPQPVPRRSRFGADATRREHSPAIERNSPNRESPSAGGLDVAAGKFCMTTPETDSDEQDPMVQGVRLRKERHGRWLREGEPSVARHLAQIGVLGWIIVVPILIGIFAGRWLDRTFGSGLFYTAPLLMLGAVLGCWSAWKWMKNG